MASSSSTLNFGLLFSVVDKATAPLRSVGRAVDAVGAAGAAVASKMKAAGDGLNKVAENLRIARDNVDNFTARARGALESIIVPASAVEEALVDLGTSIQPATGTAAEALERVKAAAVAWSTAHKQSATEFIATTKLMVASGLSETEAIKATQAALRAATATKEDAGGVAKTLSILYAQMGDKTKDASVELARLGDSLTRAKQLFPQIKVGELFDPMKDAIPAAQAAGVSVEQLVATIGQLNAAGIEGGEAGAGLANVMRVMGEASKTLNFQVVKTASGGTDLVATFAAIEKKFGKVADMSPKTRAEFEKAFGGDFKVLSMILGQTAALEANLKKVESSAGTAATAQAAFEDTMGAQAQIAAQQLDAMKLALAAGIAPAIKELTPLVTQVLTIFSGFAKEHPQLVAIGGTLLVVAVAAGTIIGPILSGAAAAISLAGSFMTAAGAALSFTAALLTNPITWIVLAIIAAVALIYIYWEPISAFFAGLWAKIKATFGGAIAFLSGLWTELVAGFRTVVGFIVGAWDRVVGFFTGAFAEIKAAFQTSFVGGMLKLLSYIHPLAILTRLWGVLIPFFLGLWKRIGILAFEGLIALGGLVVRAQAAVWSAIVATFGKLVGFFTGLWDEVRAAFSEGILTGLAKVFELFTPLGWMLRGWNALTQWLFGLSLLETGRRILSSLIAGMSSAGEWLLGLWRRAWGAVFDFLGGVGRAIADFFGPGLQNDLAGVSGVIDGVWSSIRNAVGAGLSRVGALLRVGLSALNPVTQVSAAWSALPPFFDGVWAQARGMIDRGIAGVRALLSALNPVTQVTTLWGALLSFLDGVWERARGIVARGVEALLAAIATFNPLTQIAAAWNAVAAWLANFSLRDAGMNIINTVVEGMKSVATAPFEAMQEVVQKVRNLLPFSPAKEGPLSDIHKVKLVETVADTVSPQPLVKAMTAATGEAMNVITAAAPTGPIVAPLTAPTIAAMPPNVVTPRSPASSAPGAASSPTVMNVTLRLEGSAEQGPLDQIKAFIADPANARDLAVAIQRATAHEARKVLE